MLIVMTNTTAFVSLLMAESLLFTQYT